MEAARGTVAAWMSPRPRSVDVDARVRELRALVLEEGFHHVLVLELGALVGVISDRDVLRALSPNADSKFASSHDLATLDKRAHQIMGRMPVTTKVDTPMAEAAALMLEHRTHCLPAYFRQRIAGILTSSDVLRWAVDLAAERGEVPDLAPELTARSV